MPKAEETVKVVVRCRPLSEKEVQDGRQRIVDMDHNRGEVRLTNPKASAQEAPKSFTFDQVYDWNSRQQDLYRTTAAPIVDSVLEGYNGTIFAYGQTGTGKSFTMEGKDDPEDLRGIIPNSFNHVFGAISRDAGKQEFLVRASYLEIYNEEIRDLLAKDPHKRMELKESVDRGVYVKDLMQFVVKNVSEINSVLHVGKKNRSVGSTLMNQDSSRSHSIFTITVEATSHMGETAPADDESHIRVGKLNLVDLAGSERQSKTGATGERLKEATKINLSLSALGNVISSLVDGKSGHIPYRDSKLTRLLQDSLGGNTKTVMVANLGPADYNFDETLSTLRYANRAKNIKNKPRINEDPKDAMLREFQDEIARLRSALEGKGGGGATKEKIVEKVIEKDVSAAKVEQIKAQMRAELEESLKRSISEEAKEKAKAEAEARAAAKLKAVTEESDSTEDEKAQAQAALKAQHDEIQRLSDQMATEKKEQDELEKKIKAMESKVLVGGENLLEKQELLESEAAEAAARLEAQKAQEEAAAARIAELEEEKMDFDSKYGSIEEEIAEKSKRLKKLYSNYQMKKQEIQDIQDEFQREREEMLEQIRTITQQIKLKDLVIASFIPPDYQQKIMQHCQWSDYEGVWAIDGLAHTGNYVRARKEKELAQQKDRESDQQGYAPDDGEGAVQTLLGHMQPEHKFATATKICHEILQAIADGVIGLEEGEAVLGDALAVMASKDIKVSGGRGAGAEDEPADESAAEAVGAIKRGLVSGMMKKHLVEAVVPVLIELKRLLEANQHRLQAALRECFCSLLKDYRAEVEDILVGDKQLTKEILFDMKQAEAEKEQAKARDADAAEQVRASDAHASPPAAAAAFKTPAARPPAARMPSTAAGLPAGITVATPVAASVLATAAGSAPMSGGGGSVLNGATPMPARTPRLNDPMEPMSVPRVRPSCGASPVGRGSADGGINVVHLPRIQDASPGRQWNVPPEAAAGTPGRALREHNHLPHEDGSVREIDDVAKAVGSHDNSSGSKENASGVGMASVKVEVDAVRAAAARPRRSKRKA